MPVSALHYLLPWKLVDKTLRSSQFVDEYVQGLDRGGEEAAERLKSAITSYVRKDLSDIEQDAEICVRMYANLKGLSKAYVDNKILENHEDLGLFVRGFNKKYALFDFIDAGIGKECSDAKLKSTYPYFFGIELHCTG